MYVILAYLVAKGRVLTSLSRLDREICRNEQKKQHQREAERLKQVIPAQPSSRLLRLALEIKLKIYRYAWTIDATLDKYKESYHQDGKKYIHYLRDEYLKDELQAIHKLGSICQEIRRHAYGDYFKTSQFHIQCWAEPRRKRRAPEIRNEIATMCVARNSILLRNYLQHVLLPWGPIYDMQILNSDLQNINWLGSLKQLKTLTIKITPFPFQDGVDPLFYHPCELSVPRFHFKRAWALSSQALRLQKVLFYVEDTSYQACVAGTRWVQEFMQDWSQKNGPVRKVSRGSHSPPW